MSKSSLLHAVILSLCSITANAQDTLQTQTDMMFETLREAVAEQQLAQILEIDHARLAARESVVMPPSRVMLFSDTSVNAALMQENIRAGLDLPFRVLSYGEQGKPTVSYTSSEFLSRRHALTDKAALGAFDARLDAVLQTFAEIPPTPTAAVDVGTDFGIIEIKSAYDVTETVSRLKSAVTAQSDTIWFAEIDFQKEASEEGVELVPAQLLLFGGSAPGGVAMAGFPAIGLDAFCQKLLVYASADGKAVVLFNDIEALAQNAYGRSIKPHDQLNKRLTATFRDAVN